MTPIELLTAVTALLVALVAGTVAHELAHAAVLRAVSVPCELTLLPDDEGVLAAGLNGRIAAVTPCRIPESVAPGHLRAAALAPLALLSPFALVQAGVLADPFATGNVALQLAVVGWFACALPSPQDFSLVWHPGEALAAARGR